MSKPDLGFLWDTLRIGSWNIMGMPWMPFRSLAISKIFTQNLDVIQLIEVWSPEDQATVIAAGKAKGYKYHHVPQVHNGANGCDFSDNTTKQYSEYFLYCLINQVLPGPINTQQVVQPFPYPMNMSCGEVAIGLSLASAGGQLCLSCLLNAMQELPNGESAYGALQVCGALQGKKYTNGGQNGQLILSRYPITDVQETPFETFLFNRVNVFATINNFRIGFGHFAYNVLADYGPFGPYQYGATQIDHAKDMVSKNPDIILGDFNSGLNYQPEGYNYTLLNGYADLIQPQIVDTWCPEDHLSFQPCINAGSYSAGIDHIMIKNSWKIWGSNARLFNTKPLMSDHVGVAATVRKLSFTKGSKLPEKFLEHKIV